jgi:hypothetical protein
MSKTSSMKRILLTLLLFCGWWLADAQSVILSAGNSPGLVVKSGTLFSPDSLVLTPSADLTFISNTLTKSSTALAIAPNPSIQRVYYLTSSLTYSGTIQLYYRTSELNGNTEANLKYTDLAAGGGWLQSASSTVNTALHYVQVNFTSHPFIGATANSINTLPLELVSFTGSWVGNSVPLTWVVEQTGEPVNFTVFSSTDASNWAEIGTVPGVVAPGAYTYQYTDFSPTADAMFYRISLDQASGDSIYSGIVAVHKPGAIDGALRLVTDNNSAHAYFDGAYPTAVRIINISGQVIHVDANSRPVYAIYGLRTGIYFIQYEIGGQWAAREFLIP